MSAATLGNDNNRDKPKLKRTDHSDRWPMFTALLVWSAASATVWSAAAVTACGLFPKACSAVAKKFSHAEQLHRDFKHYEHDIDGHHQLIPVRSDAPRIHYRRHPSRGHDA
jgi:hypothetical protein